MNRDLMWRLAAAVLVFSPWPGGPAVAQTTATATGPSARTQQAGRRKLWARRAARAQAVCGLVEKVRRLPLDDSATLAGLLDAHGLGLALDVALLALGEDAEVDHRQDGACKVTLTLPGERLRAALETICRRRGVRADLAKLTPPAELRCAGEAAAPAAVAAARMIPTGPAGECFARADQDVKTFWKRHVGDDARRRAERAARDDAMRRLKRRIRHVQVGPGVDLAGYVESLAPADVDVGQFLLAARPRRVGYHASAPVVAAEVEVSLRTVYACVKAWLHARGGASPADIRRMEDLIVAARGDSIRQLGLGPAAREHLKDRTPELLATTALAARAPDWLDRPIRRTGSAPLQPAPRVNIDSRERAVRSAELEARLLLAEAVAGLKVPSRGTVGEMAGRSRRARADLLAVLQAARQAGVLKFTAQATVEVTLELPQAAAWRLVFHWQLAPAAPEQ